MALYEVTAPDGTVYEVEGPENASQKDVISALRRYQTQERLRSAEEEAARLRAIADQPAPPQAPSPGFGRDVLEFGKALPRGAIGLLETGAIGASALLPEQQEKTARTGITQIAEAVRQPFTPAPGYEQGIGTGLGEGLGSTAPFYALGILGPAGIVGAGALALASGAGEARRRAEDKGATPEEIRTATQLGAGVGISEMIPVQRFTRALGSAGTGSLLDAGKRVLAQAGVEGLQEWAAAVGQNLIARGVYDPEQGVFTETGEDLGYGAGVGGIIQGLTEAVMGARGRRRGAAPSKPEEEDTTESPESIIRRETEGLAPAYPLPPETVEPSIPAPEAPVAPVAGIDESQDIQAMLREVQEMEEGVTPPIQPRAEEPVAPTETIAPPVAEQPVAPVAEQPEPVVPPEIASLPEGVILQNRERSSPVSIQQMNQIANNPDYAKVSFSNSFTDGAPVVFGPVQVPPAQIGRTGQLSSGKTKDKIPVQYAVIEAAQAIPSNSVDGTSVAQYADPNFPGFKAVTNGRLAGLQEGYRRNTMEQYKKDLMSDDIHGIDPAVIAAMQNPLLVRIMPQDMVTKDIADISNTGSTLALSATERAKNDANRIDLDGLKFREDGGISPETVKGFVASMPQAEQQELIDKQGRPTKQAYDRLNAAVFSKAYQNDELISLAAQAEDVEAKNIINALSQAAPQMAALPQGEYDVRPAVIEATEMAINARRNGQKLADAIAQQDLVSQNPVSKAIMQLYADNPRSARKIGEGLNRIAEAVNAEASKPLEPDMFGDVPVRRPLLDVVTDAVAEPNLERDLFEETAAEVRISPEQEKAEALDGFRQAIGQAIPPHRSLYANGRVYTLRPKPLTNKQQDLLVELAGSAIDLGMPASLLNKIKAAGSTSSNDLASIGTPQGWLTIGKQWASASNAEKLSGLVHEIAHASDFDANGNPKLSGNQEWAAAHVELKKWYKSSPEKHPLKYPFAPVFENKVRVRQESFAQAFAMYFTSPADLQSNAPNAYSQIDAIIKGIQNESRPAQTRSAQARGIVEPDVQQERTTGSAAVQPETGAVIPSLSPAARGQDRADRAKSQISGQISDEIDFLDRDPGIQKRTVYRTGSSAMPQGMTARDILTYEQDELGNAGVVPVPGVDLDAIPSDRLAWVTFSPEAANQYETEISSVTERDSTFRVVAQDGQGGFLIEEIDSSPDRELTQDVNPGYATTGEVRDANDVDALNEEIRESKIREYQSLKQRLSGIQRRRVEGESGITDNVMERALFRRAQDLKDEIDASKPIRSTPEDFMARASKALADGDIEREVYDVIDAMFKKNPQFLDGLRLSVREGREGVRGQYDAVRQVISLFKGYGTYDPSTIRHEMTHSMEQMMTPEARKNVVDKWMADLKKAMANDKSEQAQKYFKAIEEFLGNPSQENMDKAILAMPSYEYYQFVNPSEYWAINAEKLMGSYLGGPWQRFKTSIRGFLESIKSVLGLNNQHVLYQTFKDTINGERKNIPALADYVRKGLDLKNIDHRNYRGATAPSSWTTPPEVTTGKLLGKFSVTSARQKFQDKMIDLKDAQKEIEKLSGKTKDFMDAYVKESLYYGRVAEQTEAFLNKEARPVLQEMQESKISPEQLDAYLLAKHAPERNARIAEINDAFPDGGSGVTTAQAEAYLAKLAPERVKQLESVSKKIREMIEKTQDIEVDGGLETKETIQQWRTQWKNYVPLFRTELDYVNGGSGLGRGFDTRGPSSKRAVGSARDIKSIFTSIMEQREKAIVRAEKNRVGKALYALSIANPNPDFWLPINPDAVKNPTALKEELSALGVDPADADNLMREPKVATVVRMKDPQTGQYYDTVKYITSPNAKFSDNVFAMRVNGNNRYIVFNPNNERAKRLADSLKNLDTEQLDYLTQKVGNVTRWIASMSTQYNPIFGIWNFTRDLQGSAINLSTTPLKGKQAQIISDAFKLLPGMYKEYRAQRRGEETTGDTADLLRMFRKEGGQTGYREQFTRAEKKGTILQRELERLNPGNVKAVVNAVGGWLSDYNDTLENAVRLAAFKQARNMGLSNQQAASIAKELTVNFNRKGSKTPGLSALFAFFNAAVQGTARMVETLKGPAGRKIMAGGMLLGAIQALALKAFDFDEDEPTEFLKQRNLIIPTGGKNYIMWPMPLGFNFLPNTGRILTEMTFDGKTKARDRVVNLVEAMTDAFNPLGGAGFLQTISPTIIDPFVAIFENQDAFGRPVSREDMSTNPSPGYLRSRENSSEFSKMFAEALNYMSGGTQFTKGIVSPTADDIDYVVGQYLGGVGREAQRFYQLGKSQVTGEELEQYRIPLFGKIYGTTDSPAAVSAKFYKAVTRLAEHENEIKGRAEAGEDVGAYIDRYPEARLFRAANRLENQISQLNKTMREIRKIDKDDPRIELLKERKEELMRMFLERLAEEQ
jgi:hypothetical protein